MKTDAVLLLGPDPSAAGPALRCRAYADFHTRLRGLDGRAATLVEGPADPVAALAELHRLATVVAAGDPPTAVTELRYVPSRAARTRVADDRDGDGAWPRSVVSRQRKVIRRSTGAIFRFPVASGDLADVSGTTIEVFITDWSPCPAACAVAVHPAHPLSDGLPAGRDAAFTGRFCRHPLTGDLLPVWTAAWVRPDFGTGAVLVNPAHDGMDLAFAREAGLPVRFALAPADHGDDPGSWQVPPVVRTGVAVRTGATDGLPFDQARAAYFERLAGHGLAEAHVDVSVGAFPIAVAAGYGRPVRWDTRRRTLAGGDPDGGEVTALPVRALPPLAVLDPEIRARLAVVVAPSTSAETDLLATRLLLAEFPPQPAAPEVVLVGTVAGTVDDADPDALALTLLVGASAHETVPVKPQALESSQRFLDNHATVLGTPPGGGTSGGPAPDGPAPDGPAAARKVKAMLLAGDTKNAFTHLYRLQKALAKAPSGDPAALARYQALAHVLAGVLAKQDHGVLVEAWQQM